MSGIIQLHEQEHEEWELCGCSNRQEYRDYLNKQIWKDLTCDIKDDCYIGTHESNLQKFRRRKEEYEL